MTTRSVMLLRYYYPVFYLLLNVLRSGFRLSIASLPYRQEEGMRWYNSRNSFPMILMRTLFSGIFLLLVFLLSSCADRPIEDAFNGEYEPQKNNRVIYEYCIRCHDHKDLDAEYHMTSMTLQYTDPKYSQAKECFVCHEYSKEFWLGDEHRTTKRP